MQRAISNGQPSAPRQGASTTPKPTATPAIGSVERIVKTVPKPVWWMIVLLCLLALLFVARSAAARVEARRSERERLLLSRAVGTLQAALLPEVATELHGVRISVAYRPADGPAAGGDFYDVFELEGGLVGLIIGDVSGHGERALPKTALLRYTLRTYLSSGLCPRAALAAASETLDPQLDGMLATALVAVLDPHERQLIYASAGHPEPILIGEPRQPTALFAAPPLGSGLRTGLRQSELALAPGAALCFITDGVLDLPTPGGRLGGERLGHELAALGPAPSATDLLARLQTIATATSDDMAACILQLPGDRPLHQARHVAEELEVDRETLSTAKPALFLTTVGLSAERSAEVLTALRVVLQSSPAAVIRVVGPQRPQPRVELNPVQPTVVRLSVNGKAASYQGVS